MKDSLKYCGALLWNSVCYYKQEVGRFSLNNLKKRLLTFTTILSASTARLIHADFFFT